MLKNIKKLLLVSMSVIMVSLSISVPLFAADTTPPSIAINVPGGIKSVLPNKTITRSTGFTTRITCSDTSESRLIILLLINKSNDKKTYLSFTKESYSNGITTYSSVININPTSVLEDYRIYAYAQDSSNNVSTATYDIKYTSKDIAVEEDIKKSYTPPFWGSSFRATVTAYDFTNNGIKNCYFEIARPSIPTTRMGTNKSITKIRTGVYECSADLSTLAWDNKQGQYIVDAYATNYNNVSASCRDFKVTINPPQVYRNKYFSDGKCLDVNNYKLEDLQKIGVLDDDISSISIPAGYKVTVYSDDYFGGYYKSFTRYIGDLSLEYTDTRKTTTWDNTISSIEVSEIPAVFSQNSCQGNAAGLDIGSYNTVDLKNLGLNDKDISSIIIPGGFKATLYSGDNFTGESFVISNYNYTCYDALSDIGWDNKISSIIISAR